MESPPSGGRDFVPQDAAPACDADWLVLRKRAGRLLESLSDIPRVLLDKKGWENEHEAVFSLFRRGCLDATGNGMLEAPIYSNRCIEDAWIFLLEITRKHPNRQKHIQECARQLGQSYNWCLVLRGSKQARAVLQELPKAIQCAILESANCLDLLECPWSSPPPVQTSVQTLAVEAPLPAPNWQNEEATEHAALAQNDVEGLPSGTASAPLPGVPGENGGRFGASAPDTWAQWEAKVTPLPQAVPPSGPAGRNPFRAASQPAVGIRASTATFNGRRNFGSSSVGGTTTPPWHAGFDAPTASGGPRLTNPFAAAVPQVNSPQATTFPMPHDSTNPFKASSTDSKGRFRQRTHSFGASPTRRTVGGGAGNWTSEGPWSHPALVSAF